DIAGLRAVRAHGRRPSLLNGWISLVMTCSTARTTTDQRTGHPVTGQNAALTHPGCPRRSSLFGKQRRSALRGIGCFPADRRTDENLIDVAVLPPLTRLQRLDDRMPTSRCVRTGVPVRGVVATADRTAGCAEAQLDPAVSERHAHGTHVDVALGDPDLVQVAARRTDGFLADVPPTAPQQPVWQQPGDVAGLRG